MASESALLIPVPEAEELVGKYRLAHDPSAEWGVPAHVTVLYPFFEPKDITPERIAELRDLFSGIDPFECVFREAGAFPRLLYLRPEPHDVFVSLTRLIEARWPDYPAYGGLFDEIVPHLTIAHDVDEELIEEILAEIKPGLPVRGEAKEIHLIVGGNEGTGWESRHRFRLGGEAPPAVT